MSNADLQRVIKLVFLGEDKTQAVIRSVGNDLSKMGDAVGKVTQPLANMHDMVLKLQASLGALAVGGLAVSIQAAGEFDKGFREISSLLTTVDVDLDQFSKDVLHYASRSSFAFDETTTAVYEAISRYAEYSDALDFVSITEKLAIAGKAGLVDSTKLLASTMKAYGAEVDQASRYSDVFLRTVQLGGTTLGEVSSSLGRATPLAANLGIEIEDLGAVIATLTAGGMQTTESITGLIGIMNAVIKPSAEATKSAEELGIQFNGAGLRSKGLATFLGDVFNAAKGNDEIITSLFGRIQGLTGALALFGKDGGDAYIKTLKEMREAGGTTEAMWKVMVAGIDFQNKQLFNSIRGFLVSIGQEVLTNHINIIQAVKEIFLALQGAVNAGVFKDVFKVINELADDLVEVLQAMAKQLPKALQNVDFSGFTKSIDGLVRSVKDLFSRLFGDVDLTTAEGLNSVIQQMVNLMTTLNNVSTGIVKAWGPWADALGKVLKNSTGLNAEQEEMIGNILAVGKQLNLLAGGLSSIGGGLKDLSFAINVFAGSSLLKMAGAAGGATAALLALSAAIGYKLGTALREAVPAVDDLAQAFFKWFDYIIDKIAPVTGALSFFLDRLPQYFKDGKKEIAGATEEVENLGRVFHKIPWEKEIILDVPPLPDFDFDASIIEDEIREQVKKAADTPVVVPMELQVADIEAQSREVVAQIEAASEVVRESIKWKAELNIAEVQANAQILEAVFGAISTTITSTGETIIGLFGSLSDFVETDRSAYYQIRDQIAEEIRIRSEAHLKNIELIDAQLEWIRLRSDALERGDAMISINGEGLQPHLEAFMWEVLSAIQIRVNEEGMDYLMGIT